MKYCVVACLVFCGIATANFNQFYQPVVVTSKLPTSNEYYWEDYYGITVEHAVLINSKYIGQTFYPSENVLLPSTIALNDLFAYSVSAEKTLNATYYTKILCDPHSVLKWIPVHTNSIKQVQIDCALVPGGYANSQNLFIGKDKDENLGPVYTSDKNEFGLVIYNGSQIIRSNAHFYVLGRCLDAKYP